MFTSALYCASTLALIDLAGQMGDRAYVPALRKRYDFIKHKMNTVGWDGRWYRRFLDSNGDILGTRRAKKSIGRREKLMTNQTTSTSRNETGRRPNP